MFDFSGVKKKFRKSLKKRYGTIVPMVVGGDKQIYNFLSIFAGPQHFRRVKFQWRHERAPFCFRPVLDGYQCVKTGLIIQADNVLAMTNQFETMAKAAKEEGKLEELTKRRVSYELNHKRF